VSESDSNISSVMFWSVRFLFVAILMHAIWLKWVHTKSNTFWLIVIQASALPGLLHIIALTWNGLKCCIEDRNKYETTCQRVRKKSLHENEGHLSLVPYCTIHINKHVYSFLPLPLISHKLIPHSTHISQHNHET
jgi:hypothetical protein